MSFKYKHGESYREYMRVAIFFTGMTRTLTVTYLRQFIDRHVVTGIDMDVFAVLQETPGQDAAQEEAHIRTILGNYLVALKWFDPAQDADWIKTRDTQLAAMNLDTAWKEYLRDSGSMIEYRQFEIAADMCRRHESAQPAFSYDFIVRHRTDVVFKDVIKFPTCGDDMPDMLVSARQQYETDTYVRTSASVAPGYWLWAIRMNLFFVTPRINMDAIASIGSTYGAWSVPDDDYWFNSEMQLVGLCMHHGINYFSNTTDLEHKSLYEYDAANYFIFDAAGERIRDDGNWSCIIKRL